MSTTSRARYRRARSKHRSSSLRFAPYLIIGAGVLALFALAFLLTRSDDGGSTSGIEHRETAAVTIDGAALPSFQATEDDPAIGMKMPAIHGTDFSGRHTGIAQDGKPKIIMFLAHWCPHCQAEVPVVQDWLDQGMAHGDLDVVSVVTATDPAKPNYPPSEWLTREGWTVPVVLDDAASSAGTAAGVSSYPFFVFVDRNGEVIERAAGELPIENIEAAAAELTH